MRGLTLVTAATARPLDLDIIKAHLRIDVTDYDDLLEMYRDAAVAYLDGRDGILGRALMTQTWSLALDAWPCDGIIEIPLPPLQSVSSITYTDTSGNSQTWASSNYQVDTKRQPARIVPAYNATLPSLRGGYQINQVTVQFVAGYGDNANNVPVPIRQALLLLVTHMYERREPVIVGGVQVHEVPWSIRALLASFIVPGFG